MSDGDDDQQQQQTAAAVQAGDDITFLADDGTVEIPWPARRYIVCPSAGLTDDQFDVAAARGMTIFLLPHPRSDAMCLMSLAPTSADELTLCHVGGFQPTGEHSAWFAGDHIEPDGTLHVMTPFDMTYLAIWLLFKQADKPIDGTAVTKWYGDASARPDLKYKDVSTMVAAASVNERLDKLEGLGLMPALEAALATVAETQDVGDDRYYRLSIAKVTALMKERYDELDGMEQVRLAVYPVPRQLPQSPVPRVESVAATRKSARNTAQNTQGDDDTDLQQRRPTQPGAETPGPRQTTGSIGVEATPLAASPLFEATPATPAAAASQATATQSQQPPAKDRSLQLRTLHLLLEWLPRQLHTAVAKHCGVDLEGEGAARAAATRAAIDSMVQAEYEAAMNTPDDVKKSRAGSGLQAKSSSVKRLEKAGKPKGTPTLASFFAKKK